MRNRRPYAKTYRSSSAWMDGCAYAVFFVIIALILIGSMGRGLLVNTQEGVDAAEVLGFSDLTIVEDRWLLVGFTGCDAGDARSLKMTGTNSNGDDVTFVMCSGWPFKGWTLRV